MTAKRFRVNELVKYNYSDIGEYIDENHTDKPLRNDEVVELLNELHEENENLKDVNVQCCNDYSAMRRDVLRYKEENEQLKQYKQASSDVLRSWSQKNLTAKQLQVVIAIMEELNILGDVE